MTAGIVSVAMPAPCRALFDYLVPPGVAIQPGMRVRAPFGRRHAVGVAIELRAHSAVAQERLKPIIEVLDGEPLLSGSALRLVRWAAQYYYHPVGEAVAAALPPSVRAGRALPTGQRRWRRAPDAPEVLPGRGPVAARLGRTLAGGAIFEHDRPTARERAWLRRWEALGLLVIEQAPLVGTPAPAGGRVALNEAQRVAAADIVGRLGAEATILLHGVTGSGKTEVYLEVVAATLARGLQALLLVPEIGLTPQLVDRLGQMGAPLALLHSGLTDGERALSWTAAQRGEAAIVLGTRSAVFAPLRRPGVIIVDEEHDLSYKQQEGFRYHARDLAVLRGHYESVPVVLGSATPSLESLRNVADGRYRLVSLPQRAQARPLPRIELIDLRRQRRIDGLAPSLIERLRTVYDAREQALLFLNRRGFAPVLACRSCSWVAACSRCDARMTWHQVDERLRCHHCGADHPLPVSCPECASTSLAPQGAGTQRIESALRRHFPEASIARIDRDTTSGKGALAGHLGHARSTADFLVGTQMLSKGHDFPRVTLVAVLGIDGALNSSDFRGPEHAAQLLVQVAGRAGRGDRPGTVLIQTQRPGDPLFAALSEHDYLRFAEDALKERALLAYPPHGTLALLHAQTKRPGEALQFLADARALGTPLAQAVTLFDPVPHVMEKRAGWHRAQLLVHAQRRADLHQFLGAWLSLLERQSGRVRWSLDVDPQLIAD